MSTSLWEKALQEQTVDAARQPLQEGPMQVSDGHPLSAAASSALAEGSCPTCGEVYVHYDGVEVTSANGHAVRIYTDTFMDVGKTLTVEDYPPNCPGIPPNTIQPSEGRLSIRLLFWCEYCGGRGYPGAPEQSVEFRQGNGTTEVLQARKVLQ